MEKYNHSTKAKITFKRSVNNLKIYLQDVLHVDIKLDSYVGLQSWYVNKNDCKIEIYLKERLIILEYNSVEKWKEILKILEGNI